MTSTWVKDSLRKVANVTDFDAQYPKVLEQVKADAALGRQLNVQATPTFFVNGIKINGGFRPLFMEAVIEHEVEKTGATSLLMDAVRTEALTQHYTGGLL